MSFGEYLVGLREDRGVSRRKLHERSGLSLSYLHQIENGNFLPGPDNLHKIADALPGVNADDLIRRRDAIELERMGFDSEATLLLKEMGDLSDKERQRIIRLYRRIRADREDSK
jgi:transcriptional regulator with XRE-family HTH domain